jgi:hypothetical protein
MMEEGSRNSSDDESKVMESSRLVDEESHVERQDPTRLKLFSIFWKFTTLFFALLSLKLAVYPQCQPGCTSACERGVLETFLGIHLPFSWNCVDTDTEVYNLEPAKASSSLEVVRFTGGIEENEDGRLYRVEDASVQYVGPPNPEIDNAWSTLLTGMSK